MEDILGMCQMGVVNEYIQMFFSVRTALLYPYQLNGCRATKHARNNKGAWQLQLIFSTIAKALCTMTQAWLKPDAEAPIDIYIHLKK